MNIFKLDENPFVCAKYHCDKHVPKMGLETTQMMNTAIHYYRDRFSATFVKFKKDIDQAELKELSPRGMIDYYITDAIETLSPSGRIVVKAPSSVKGPVFSTLYL